MKEAGKIALLWSAVVGVFAVSGALTLFLLQGRATEVAIANDADGLTKHAHIVLGIAASSSVSIKNVLANTNTLLRTANSTVATLKTTTNKLSAAIDTTSRNINAPCPGAAEAALHPCGTLADFNRTLATARGTAGQVEVSLRTFNTHDAELYGQEKDAYTAMSKSVIDFDTLVSDPELRMNIHNAAVITGNAATISTDGKNWLHAKLYPTKKKGLISGFEATGDVVHHWLPPLF